MVAAWDRGRRPKRGRRADVPVVPSTSSAMASDRENQSRSVYGRRPAAQHRRAMEQSDWVPCRRCPPMAESEGDARRAVPGPQSEIAPTISTLCLRDQAPCTHRSAMYVGADRRKRRCSNTTGILATRHNGSPCHHGGELKGVRELRIHKPAPPYGRRSIG
jgi:hypothetical protein